MRENCGPNCSIVLVANKADVPPNERDVSTKEGELLAEKHRLDFYEVSTMNNTGVREAMYALARLMCLKFETLKGDVAAFNDIRLSVGAETPGLEGGFKIGTSSSSFGCCVSRD